MDPNSNTECATTSVNGKPFYKKYYPVILALLISPLFGILFSDGMALKSFANFTIAFVWSFVIWITQWYGNEFVYILVDRKISWEKQPVLKTIVLFTSIAVFAAVAIIIVNLSFTVVVFGGMPENLSGWIIYNGRMGIIIALSVSTIITTIGFYKAWRRVKSNEDKLKNELLDFQYKALVNQVNPHFLFNSLNVLSSLVHEDPELAENFIQQLSKVYRYTLETRENELVPLESELKFIESYLFLLKIRFEDSLNYSITIPENKAGLIIPMALQILVENAIKHNLVSRQSPLEIKIEICDDAVCVRNNLQPVSSTGKSTGFGLESIKNRLAYMSDKQLQTEKTESEFIARLPLIKTENA